MQGLFGPHVFTEHMCFNLRVSALGLGCMALRTPQRKSFRTTVKGVAHLNCALQGYLCVLPKHAKPGSLCFVTGAHDNASLPCSPRTV